MLVCNQWQKTLPDGRLRLRVTYPIGSDVLHKEYVKMHIRTAKKCIETYKAGGTIEDPREENGLVIWDAYIEHPEKVKNLKMLLVGNWYRKEQ